jgi:hypothetical protein
MWAMNSTRARPTVDVVERRPSLGGREENTTMLAYDYPLLGMFWTMLIFFMWIVWIMLLIRVFADIFRSHDMGGGAKALWSIFVIVFPFLGVFVYMIARGRSMTQRDVAVAQQNEAAFQTYVRGVASDGVSTADELAKLSELRAKGVLTDAEYEQQKTKLLA